MITIHNIGLLSRYSPPCSIKYGYNIGSLAVKYGVMDIINLPEKEQLNIFLEINSNNGSIIVMPHGDSFLRRTFIEKLLNDNGFIKNKYLSITLCTNIQEKEIKYRVINHIKNYRHEKRRKITSPQLDCRKIEMDGTDYMEVRTIGGEFRVMYRMDHIIYSMLDSLEEENKDSLAVIFGNIMAVATVIDADFHHDVIVATQSLIDRINHSSISNEIETEEESQNIISEMKAEYEATNGLDDRTSE